MVHRRRLLAALAATGAAAAPGAGQARPAAALTPNSGPGDIRTFGAKSDGVTDDAQAILRSAASGAVVFPAGITRVARDVRVAAVASAAPGARIEIAEGATVTFEAGFSAPRDHVFIGAGKVAFNPARFDVGLPEWWGARNGDPAFDSAPALNACIAACPVTDLAAGAYYVRSRVEVAVDNRKVRGRGASQKPYGVGGVLSPVATQIVLTDPSATGIVVGRDQSDRPPALLEFVTLEDFVVVRATAEVPLGVAGAQALANPPTGALPCPIGIAFKWVANGHFNKVLTIEHAIGFYIYGCVESYWNNCGSLRATLGAEPGNDRWSGFYLDYGAPSGYAGGNASIYLTECRAFSGTGQGKGAKTYTSGVTTVGGFVDLFITRLETGLVFFGIDLQGDGASAEDPHTEDLHIEDCILDSPVVAGIRIQNAGRVTAVEINGLYVGLARDCGAAGVLLENVGGLVAVNGAQIIGGGANGRGIAATDLAVLTTSGNIITNVARPVSLTRVNYSKLSETIHATRADLGRNMAVSLADCQRCIVEVSISGVPDGYVCGVGLDGTSAYNRVDPTMIEPSTVGGAANKIFFDARPWGGAGVFGTGNIASGVLG